MKKLQLKKHVLTGISFMIPVVVAGGICMGLGKIFGGAVLEENTFSWVLDQIGAAAMGFTVPVVAAGISYSIAQRPGIVPGLAVGFMANSVGAGFLGGLLGGFLAGWITQFYKTYIRLPKSMSGLMPILVLPVLSTLTIGLIFQYVIGAPMAAIQTAMLNWLNGMQGASRYLLGAIIGGMRVDMGGPLAQSAYAFSTGMLGSGVEGPMAASIVSGMTPPLGVALAVLLARKKFTRAEHEAAKAAVPLGLCFITEGVFPFLAADPLRIIISCTAGSIAAGALSMGLGVTCGLAHGGMFAIPFTNHPLGFLLALAAGTVVTALVLVAIKPRVKQSALAEEEEEEALDIDIDF